MGVIKNKKWFFIFLLPGLLFYILSVFYPIEEPLRDFLTDILVNYKIDKYYLKMQLKNQFVKISFYELVLFWSNSANLKLSVCFIFFITFIGSPSRDSGCHRS